MGILEVKNKAVYGRKFKTAESRETIISIVRSAFESLGEVIEITCSEPLPVIGKGAYGIEVYYSEVFIEVTQDKWFDLISYCDKFGWVRQDGLF